MLIKVNSRKKNHPLDCNSIAGRRKSMRSGVLSEQGRKQFDKIFRRGK